MNDTNKLTYIISDIKKAVFFEHTAILLKKNGVTLNFILINSKNTPLDLFLKENKFQIEYLNAKRLLLSFIPIIICAITLKKNKTQTIHCHLGTANWIGLWAGKIAGVKKRIYTRHSGEPLAYRLKEKMIDKIQNRLATDIVSISLNITEILKRQGVPKDKITLIHHGFDIKRFQIPNQEEVIRIREQYNPENQTPIIGVIARWMEWKGIHYIIKAFKELLVEFPNAKLILFNASDNGDYVHELNQLLNELPLENYKKVAFEENIYDLYQLFDIYIHTPVNPQCEAFGQTYVEALAAGIPSIFTLSGVAREFITENDAEIVAFMDSQEIFKKMIKLASSMPKKITYIQKLSELFSFEIYINNLMLLYGK